MALQLFGFHGRPHDFAVTKADVPLEQCSFLLDFSRPLIRVRWFGFLNRWVGPTLSLHVPIVHEGETNGGYVFGVRRSQPYFYDIEKLWKEHYRTPRTLGSPAATGLQIVADFGKHFAEDC